MAKKDNETKKEKVVKNEKEIKKVKTTKKEKKKEEKKAPKESYFEGVRQEMSKVKWPSKKEVIKYTIATIVFMVVLVGFFILMSLLMSWIKGAFN